MEKVSKVEDFGKLEEVTRLVELPIPMNGKKPVIQVRALNMARLGIALGGAPIIGGGASAEDGVKVAESIAREGIVDPPFSFGEEREPGKVWWQDLPAGNQGAIVQAIYVISGAFMNRDAEVGDRLIRFPDVKRGRADGKAAGATVPAR